MGNGDSHDVDIELKGWKHTKGEPLFTQKSDG